MRVKRHHLGASAIRLLSVTAAAATACALWAGTASAATASAGKLATSTSMSISPKTQWVGASVTLSATVKSRDIPRGTVTFKSGRTTLCRGSLFRGSTHCRTSFGSRGTYGVRAYYSGGPVHKPSNSGIARVRIYRSATTTNITNANPTTIHVGQSVTFDVTVSSRAGAPAAAGNVLVAPTTKLPGAYSCTATVVGGKGSCKITPPDYGIVDYTASYEGNAGHMASAYAGPFALAVQNVTSTTVGPATAAAGTVSLTASVYAMGADITGGMGSVTFYNGTTLIAACPAVPLSTFDTGTRDNVATCTTTLAAGKYTINAKYSGDEVNEASSGSGTIVVS